MTVRIEFDEAVQLLREIVAEKGEDYVYERTYVPELDDSVCYYVRNDCASCIVGHLLHRSGVPLEGLAAREQKSPYHLRDVGLFESDAETLNLLTEVQSQQDHGIPWGEALKRAIAYIKDGYGQAS